MNKLLVLLVVFISFSFLSCSSRESGSPLDVLEKFTSGETIEEKAGCIDEKSRKGIYRAVEKGIISLSQSRNVFPPLVPGSTWQVTADDKGSDPRIISVKITGHPVLNKIGFVVRIKFIREKNQWKIDLSDEVSQLSKRKRPENVMKYMKSRGE